MIVLGSTYWYIIVNRCNLSLYLSEPICRWANSISYWLNANSNGCFQFREEMRVIGGRSRSRNRGRRRRRHRHTKILNCICILFVFVVIFLILRIVFNWFHGLLSIAVRFSMSIICAVWFLLFSLVLAPSASLSLSLCLFSTHWLTSQRLALFLVAQHAAY